MKFCTSASAPRALLGRALLGLAALAALLAGALLSLADAYAVPPPDDVQLIIGTDDPDGVIEPGQTVNVTAAIRFTGPYAEPERMAADQIQLISSMGWDNGTGSRISISGQQWAMGAEWLWPIRDAGENQGYGIIPNTSNTLVQAMDGRTAIARPTSNHGPQFRSNNFDIEKLFIYDLWNKQQVLTIARPEGATYNFGTSQTLGPTVTTGPYDGNNRYHDRNDAGIAVAVWHETDSKAWIFAGDARAATGGQLWVGRLFIYSLDWSTDPPTPTLHGSIAPPLSEAGNFYRGANTTAHWTAFGSSVTISADGSTLAVGAPWMNVNGAVYIYTRPDGEGESWADLAYEDGVKVTPHPVPHWGTSEATGVPKYTDQANCDADCIAQRAGWDGRLGIRSIALSEDGRVMAVGAPFKNYGSVVGAFGNATMAFGEAYVFVAPEGGWQAAPDVVTGKTVIPAKTATPADYSKETHISPGPNRRITKATVTLLRRPWPTTGWNFHHTGYRVSMSLDGATIGVGTSGVRNNPGSPGAGPGRILIFQVDSADDWADVPNNLWTAEDADAVMIHNLSVGTRFGSPGWCNFGFNGDASLLLLGLCGFGGSWRGEWVYLRRPDSGRWASGAFGTLRAGTGLMFEPVGARAWAAFGIPVWSLKRDRFVINARDESVAERSDTQGTSGPGRAYFNDGGCYERREYEVSTLTCPLILGEDATITVPLGTEPGTLTLSGQVRLSMDGNDAGSTNAAGMFNHRDITNSKTVKAEPITVQIGEVQKLAEARFEVATGSSSSIKSGERTTLRLQLLDENGKRVDGRAIASILATTSRGVLSSSILHTANSQNINGCLGGGGDACQIDPALLSGVDEQSALLMRSTAQGRGLVPRVPIDRPLVAGESTSYNADNILLTLAHSGVGGPADVSVRVVGKDGTSVSSEVVRIDLTGPPTALSIAEPNAGVLGIDTPDADDEDEPDNRDILKLSVTAADANGLKVAVPTNRSMSAWVTGPDGRRVTSGLEIAWPLGGSANPTRDSSRNLQVQVDVDRAANTPLANGEYTLTVRAGSLSAEQKFMVSGVPAAVALSDPPEAPALQSQVSVTATITDAAGDPVPDGTRVTWESLTYSLFGDSTALVQLSADARTTAGQAESTWLVVGPGQASIRATAGTATEIALVNIPDPSAAPPEPESLAKSLSSTMPNAPASWLGATSVQASDLLAALEGVTTIQLWQYNRWVRYGVVDSRVVPGSFDFIAQPGDVLWLSE